MDWFTRHLSNGDGLDATIEISGKPMEVRCTPSAARELKKRTQPLFVEVELALACFARKEVRFRDKKPDNDLTFVSDNLAVYVHALVPETCNIDDAPMDSADQSGPSVEAYNFVPKWLRIDFRKGGWLGEYGL